jgi:hypothetical protein
MDGCRVKRWHGQTPGQAYGRSWYAGDRVTVLMDLEAGRLSYALNGMSMGTAFEGLERQVKWYPALSLSPDQGCRVLFGGPLDPIAHLPEGYRGVGEHFYALKARHARSPSHAAKARRPSRMMMMMTGATAEPRESSGMDKMAAETLAKVRVVMDSQLPSSPPKDPADLRFYFEAALLLKGAETPHFGCVDREANLYFLVTHHTSAYLMSSTGNAKMLYNRGFEEGLYEYLEGWSASGTSQERQPFPSAVRVVQALPDFALQDGDILGCGITDHEVLFTRNGVLLGRDGSVRAQCACGVLWKASLSSRRHPSSRRSACMHRNHPSGESATLCPAPAATQHLPPVLCSPICVRPSKRRCCPPERVRQAPLACSHVSHCSQ